MTDTTSSSSTSERAALVREAREESREWATFADLAQTMGALVAERETGTIDIAGTADLLHRLATALEAADADAERLREALEWAMSEISDGAAYHDDNGIPEHDCEFSSNPEKGACDFHDRWVEAERLTGQLAARVAEELTR